MVKVGLLSVIEAFPCHTVSGFDDVSMQVNMSAENFANSLHADQSRQNVGLDLNQKLFDTLMVFRKRYSK